MSCLLVSLFVVLTASEPTATPPDDLTLEVALSEAAAHAPGLAAAQARQDVARGALEATRTVNPLGVALGAGGNDPRWTVGLTQRLPLFGSRAARIRAAEQGVVSAEAERFASEARLRAETRRAYFALVRAGQLAETSARSLELIRESESIARLRVETGAAPELEAVQVGLTRASAEVQLAAQRGEVAALSAGLALYLGREPRRALRPMEPSAAPPLPALEDVITRAEGAPSMRARQADITSAEATLQAARRERLPVPSVGIAVEGDGPGGRSVSLRGALDLEVPLPGLGRGEVDQAEASLRLARALADEERLRRRSDIVVAHQRLAAALAALARFPEEILPAADKAQRMALEAYRAGRTPLVALNDARRAATDTQAQAVEARFAAQTAFAELELAVGVALDEN